MGLLNAHRCGGDRLLLTCENCVHEEIVGPSSDDNKVLELMEVLTSDDVSEHFEVCTDAGWESLPSSVGIIPNNHFGERDRRLATAADVKAQELDEETWLVSDDEDFLENLRSEAIQKMLAVFPIASGPLLLHLFRCGALTAPELESVLAAEQDRVDADHAMSPRKREMKQNSLDKIAVSLGFATP